MSDAWGGGGDDWWAQAVRSIDSRREFVARGCKRAPEGLGERPSSRVKREGAGTDADKRREHENESNAPFELPSDSDDERAAGREAIADFGYFHLSMMPQEAPARVAVEAGARAGGETCEAVRLALWERGSKAVGITRLAELAAGSPPDRLAAHVLAGGCENGFGKAVDEDLEKSLKWYLVAAEGSDGVPQAMVEAGQFYAAGEGGADKDTAEADKWYRRAREAFGRNDRDPAAMCGLASCLMHGLGGDVDTEGAFKLLSTAAAGEPPFVEAVYLVGECYENGSGVAANMSTAVEWYEKAAALDHVYALDSCGTALFSAGDYRGAAKYYRRAADLGFADAQYHLGETISKLKESNYTARAGALFRKAAAQGHSDAMATVGFYYLDGLWPGQGANRARGLAELERSVELDSLCGLYWLGKDLCTSAGRTDADRERGADLLRTAKEMGCSHACALVAELGIEE